MLTRRELIRRGAVVGGAAAGISLAGTKGLELVFGGPELTAPRKRTYSSLITAVGRVRGNQVDPRRAKEAASEFAALYPDRSDSHRDHIDTVLDALDARAPGGSFSEMEPARALSFLRELKAGPPRQGGPTLVTYALGLAGELFQPDPLIFHPTLPRI